MPRCQRSSPKFSLLSQWKRSKIKLMSESGIPMLRDNKACMHIKYKTRSNMYISINELKIRSGSSDHIHRSTCLNITYKELINDAEVER